MNPACAGIFSGSSHTCDLNIGTPVATLPGAWCYTYRVSNMQVYLRDESAQIILRAATLRQKLQIQLSISPSHSLLTPGQPVPALTLSCQAPGKVATGMTRPQEKSWRKWDLNPRSTLEVDALTCEDNHSEPTVIILNCNKHWLNKSPNRIISYT